MERVLMSWSGGKDSALALHDVLASGRYEVAALLTTVTKDYDRISMHGVRRSLLKQQAESLGLPLEEVFITRNASTGEYESSMREALTKYKESGVDSVVHGDIFLEDVRKYREDKLAQIDMHCIFPLWKADTRELLARFMRARFRAITTCVDTKALDKTFVGRDLDETFLSDLPGGVDPCGENGEFHSFVYDGPIFKRRIEFTIGEKVLRENRFAFCDLVERGE